MDDAVVGFRNRILLCGDWGGRGGGGGELLLSDSGYHYVVWEIIIWCLWKAPHLKCMDVSWKKLSENLFEIFLLLMERLTYFGLKCSLRKKVSHKSY